jgi:hypothetical protein
MMPSATPKVMDPKLSALLELERRGELPDDLKPQLQMYRQQGIAKPLSPTPPTTPADNAFANDEVLSQIDKARDLATNHWTTGWGSYLAGAPATQAHDLASTIGTIHSSLALDELAKMRASSPTGGALGNVTEGEERLLADKTGALNQSDSKENFLDNLAAVERSYGRLALKYKGIDPDSEQGKGLLSTFSAPHVVAAPASGGPPSPPASPPGSGNVPGSPPPAPVPSTPLGTGDPSAQRSAISSDGSSTFSTQEDKAFAAEANALLKHSGTTRAEFDALARRYGRAPFGADLDQVISYRNNGGRFASIGVPTTGHSDGSTIGTIAASPGGALAISAGNGVTAGHLGDLVSTLGGDPDAQAKVDASAAANPGVALAGNVIGGTIGALGGEAALGALGVPRIAALGGMSLPTRALAGDALYGGVGGYRGDAPIQGALTGAALGVGGGVAGRQLGALASPTVGKLDPLYEAGVRPTLGQRFAGSGRAGAALNMVEEASQSIPVLGMLPRMARQDARDQFERGAFNSALGHLEGVPGVESSLPADMKLGTQPHAFMQTQFNKAYDQARSGMTFAPDKQYIADLGSYRNELMNGVLSDNQVDQVRKILNNAVQTRLSAQGGRLTGDAYKQAASDVGKAAQKLSGSDPLVADALRDYSTIFDNAARRNSAPAAVEMLDKADAGYAKAVRVEMAAAARGGDTGRFSPTRRAEPGIPARRLADGGLC